MCIDIHHASIPSFALWIISIMYIMLCICFYCAYHCHNISIHTSISQVTERMHQLILHHLMLASKQSGHKTTTTVTLNYEISELLRKIFFHWKMQLFQKISTDQFFSWNRLQFTPKTVFQIWTGTNSKNKGVTVTVSVNSKLKLHFSDSFLPQPWYN